MMMRKRGRDDPKLLRKKVDPPLTVAIREEIKRLADEEKFTLGTLKSIERVAAHGRAMLQGTAQFDALLGGGNLLQDGGIGAVGYDSDGLEDELLEGGRYIGGTIQSSSSVENFGSRAMRELTAMLPKILEGRNRPSTVELVRALSEARKQGLDDVAADLERQIKRVKDEPEPATVERSRSELTRSAYFAREVDHPNGGRYVAPGDPGWSVDRYNEITGESATAQDFEAALPSELPDDETPEIGGAA